VKPPFLMQRPAPLPEGHSTLLSVASPLLTRDSQRYADGNRSGPALFPDIFTDAPFVGRAQEMAVLQADLEEACAGHGRLLLLGPVSPALAKHV
jgi:hypothetical protein